MLALVLLLFSSEAGSNEANVSEDTSTSIGKGGKSQRRKTTGGYYYYYYYYFMWAAHEEDIFPECDEGSG